MKEATFMTRCKHTRMSKLKPLARSSGNAAPLAYEGSDSNVLENPRSCSASSSQIDDRGWKRRDKRNYKPELSNAREDKEQDPVKQFSAEPKHTTRKLPLNRRSIEVSCRAFKQHRRRDILPRYYLLPKTTGCMPLKKKKCKETSRFEEKDRTSRGRRNARESSFVLRTPKHAWNICSVTVCSNMNNNGYIYEFTVNDEGRNEDSDHDASGNNSDLCDLENSDNVEAGREDSGGNKSDSENFESDGDADYTFHEAEPQDTGESAVDTEGEGEKDDDKQAKYLAYGHSCPDEGGSGYFTPVVTSDVEAVAEKTPSCYSQESASSESTRHGPSSFCVDEDEAVFRPLLSNSRVVPVLTSGDVPLAVRIASFTSSHLKQCKRMFQALRHRAFGDDFDSYFDEFDEESGDESSRKSLSSTDVSTSEKRQSVLSSESDPDLSKSQDGPGWIQGGLLSSIITIMNRSTLWQNTTADKPKPKLKSTGYVAPQIAADSKRFNFGRYKETSSERALDQAGYVLIKKASDANDSLNEQYGKHFRFGKQNNKTSMKQILCTAQIIKNVCDLAHAATIHGPNIAEVEMKKREKNLPFGHQVKNVGYVDLASAEHKCLDCKSTNRSSKCSKCKSPHCSGKGDNLEKSESVLEKRQLLSKEEKNDPKESTSQRNVEKGNGTEESASNKCDNKKVVKNENDNKKIVKNESSKRLNHKRAQMANNKSEQEEPGCSHNLDDGLTKDGTGEKYLPPTVLAPPKNKQAKGLGSWSPSFLGMGIPLAAEDVKILETGTRGADKGKAYKRRDRKAKSPPVITDTRIGPTILDENYVLEVIEKVRMIGKVPYPDRTRTSMATSESPPACSFNQTNDKTPPKRTPSGDSTISKLPASSTVSCSYYNGNPVSLKRSLESVIDQKGDKPRSSHSSVGSYFTNSPKDIRFLDAEGEVKATNSRSSLSTHISYYTSNQHKLQNMRDAVSSTNWYEYNNTIISEEARSPWLNEPWGTQPDTRSSGSGLIHGINSELNKDYDLFYHPRKSDIQNEDRTEYEARVLDVESPIIVRRCEFSTESKLRILDGQPDSGCSPQPALGNSKKAMQLMSNALEVVNHDPNWGQEEEDVLGCRLQNVSNVLVHSNKPSSPTKRTMKTSAFEVRDMPREKAKTDILFPKEDDPKSVGHDNQHHKNNCVSDEPDKDVQRSKEKLTTSRNANKASKSGAVAEIGAKKSQHSELCTMTQCKAEDLRDDIYQPQDQINELDVSDDDAEENDPYLGQKTALLRLHRRENNRVRIAATQEFYKNRSGSSNLLSDIANMIDEHHIRNLQKSNTDAKTESTWNGETHAKLATSPKTTKPEKDRRGTRHSEHNLTLTSATDGRPGLSYVSSQKLKKQERKMHPQRNSAHDNGFLQAQNPEDDLRENIWHEETEHHSSEKSDGNNTQKTKENKTNISLGEIINVMKTRNEKGSSENSGARKLSFACQKTHSFKTCTEHGAKPTTGCQFCKKESLSCENGTRRTSAKTQNDAQRSSKQNKKSSLSRNRDSVQKASHYKREEENIPRLNVRLEHKPDHIPIIDSETNKLMPDQCIQTVSVVCTDHSDKLMSNQHFESGGHIAGNGDSSNIKTSRNEKLTTTGNNSQTLEQDLCTEFQPAFGFDIEKEKLSKSTNHEGFELASLVVSNGSSGNVSGSRLMQALDGSTRLQVAKCSFNNIINDTDYWNQRRSENRHADPKSLKVEASFVSPGQEMYQVSSKKISQRNSNKIFKSQGTQCSQMSESSSAESLREAMTKVRDTERGRELYYSENREALATDLEENQPATPFSFLEHRMMAKSASTRPASASSSGCKSELFAPSLIKGEIYKPRKVVTFQTNDLIIKNEKPASSKQGKEYKEDRLMSEVKKLYSPVKTDYWDSLASRDSMRSVANSEKTPSETESLSSEEHESLESYKCPQKSMATPKKNVEMNRQRMCFGSYLHNERQQKQEHNIQEKRRDEEENASVDLPSYRQSFDSRQQTTNEKNKQLHQFDLPHKESKFFKTEAHRNTPRSDAERSQVDTPDIRYFLDQQTKGTKGPDKISGQTQSSVDEYSNRPITHLSSNEKSVYTPKYPNLINQCEVFNKSSSRGNLDFLVHEKPKPEEMSNKKIIPSPNAALGATSFIIESKDGPCVAIKQRQFPSSRERNALSSMDSSLVDRISRTVKANMVKTKTRNDALKKTLGHHGNSRAAASRSISCYDLFRTSRKRSSDRNPGSAKTRNAYFNLYPRPTHLGPRKFSDDHFEDSKRHGDIYRLSRSNNTFNAASRDKGEMFGKEHPSDGFFIPEADELEAKNSDHMRARKAFYHAPERFSPEIRSSKVFFSFPEKRHTTDLNKEAYCLRHITESKSKKSGDQHKVGKNQLAMPFERSSSAADKQNMYKYAQDDLDELARRDARKSKLERCYTRNQSSIYTMGNTEDASLSVNHLDKARLSSYRICSNGSRAEVVQAGPRSSQTDVTSHKEGFAHKLDTSKLRENKPDSSEKLPLPSKESSQTLKEKFASGQWEEPQESTHMGIFSRLFHSLARQTSHHQSPNEVKNGNADIKEQKPDPADKARSGERTATVPEQVGGSREKEKDSSQNRNKHLRLHSPRISKADVRKLRPEYNQNMNSNNDKVTQQNVQKRQQHITDQKMEILPVENLQEFPRDMTEHLEEYTRLSAEVALQFSPRAIQRTRSIIIGVPFGKLLGMSGRQLFRRRRRYARVISVAVKWIAVLLVPVLALFMGAFYSSTQTTALSASMFEGTRAVILLMPMLRRLAMLRNVRSLLRNYFEPAIYCLACLSVFIPTNIVYADTWLCTILKTFYKVVVGATAGFLFAEYQQDLARRSKISPTTSRVSSSFTGELTGKMPTVSFSGF